jgi:uncharacterized protein YbjT (DUF2867 family)
MTEHVVLGATGKTGRRVVERLRARGESVRLGSRSAQPTFDWEDPATWPDVLAGVETAYVSYYPDVAVPGATEAISALSELAVSSGLRRLVLISGRGEEGAQKCEKIVQNSGIPEWAIVRASWFNQNFSESYLLEPVQAGEVALPAGDVPEPFIDADDIADVAVEALLGTGSAGQIYEVTGPRMLTFAEAVAEISHATGRDIRYVQVPTDDFLAALPGLGVPQADIELLDLLFNTVLDGRNSHLTDGVQRALGRPPRDFADYARETAATGVWNER